MTSIKTHLISFSEESTEKVEGIAEGSGKVKWFDGYQYKGQLKKGIPEGYGLLSTPDGLLYEGLFKSGKFTQGLLHLQDGGIVEGKWDHDTIVGEATQYFSDYTIYKGLFIENKPQSLDKFIDENENKFNEEREERISINSEERLDSDSSFENQLQSYCEFSAIIDGDQDLSDISFRIYENVVEMGKVLKGTVAGLDFFYTGTFSSRNYFFKGLLVLFESDARGKYIQSIFKGRFCLNTLIKGTKVAVGSFYQKGVFLNKGRVKGFEMKLPEPSKPSEPYPKFLLSDYFTSDYSPKSSIPQFLSSIFSQMFPSPLNPLPPP